ncbi:Spore wall maturation protein DIT1, partial [Diplodia seriata]
GKPLFVEKVMQQLEKNQPIRMILPAFPWKSINKVDKVTGILPDLGEELALARLNQMCEDIRVIYPLGGEVHIATDGMVFDDVVGIPDEDTWAYSEGLMDIVRKRGYESHIKLMRVMDILGHTAGRTLDKELYLSLTQQCREELLASFGRTEEEVREMMREDSDTLLTYCGFIRFLESDLRHSEVSKTATSGQKFRKCVKKVAINMMIRAESFTKLLQAKCPDYVRLSIHPSTGAVKLSVPLIVTGTGEFPRTPWHSSVALALDGSYSTVHSKSVRDTHVLVARDDDAATPHFFREKSELWDWEDADVVFEPLYPNRLVVRPRRGVEAKSLSEEQIEKLAKLRAVHTAGPVEVVGFANAAAAAAAAAA